MNNRNQLAPPRSQGLGVEVAANRRQRLDWRDSATENVSYSDWKLTVVNGLTEESTVYYVHRVYLARGKVQSSYFDGLFRPGSGFKEAVSSELTLGPAAVNAFPKLLDYAYDLSEALLVDTASAMGLLELGEYLGIKDVFDTALAFIRKDMTRANMNTYWEDAIDCPYDTIIPIFTDFWMEHQSDFRPTDPFVLITHLAVWESVALKIAEMKDSDARESCGRRFSQLFAVFATHQTQPLKAEVICSVLSVEAVPVIHPEAAFGLAELIQKFLIEGIRGPLLLKMEPGDDVDSSLAERVCLALAQYLEPKFLHKPEHSIDMERLEQLPGRLWGKTMRYMDSMRMEQAAEVDPRVMELKTKMKNRSRKEVETESRHMEKQRRSELNDAFKRVRKASPEAAYKEIIDSPQYQETEKFFDRMREMYDEIICSQHLMKESLDENVKPRVKKPKKVDMPAPTRTAVDDPYPVGTKCFARDPDDGYGGLEYPASVIEPLDSAGMPANKRRVTFPNYGEQYDRDVYIHELFEVTKERDRIYNTVTVPKLKHNDNDVEDFKRKHGWDSATQLGPTDYEVGATYYLRHNDGIEYPVMIKRKCPRKKHKCEVNFVGCGNRANKLVEYWRLLPATTERQSLFKRQKEATEQAKLVKANEKQLRDEKRMSNKRKRGNDGGTSSKPRAKTINSA